jgi:crotonobetainyl-CoA:carnitine CoA-transferase CaiB-like acyl-CoA transferase
MMTPDSAPLAGLVVIELGHSVAAPFAGQILGDLGAEVIERAMNLIGPRLSFDGARPPIRARPPRLGEHTEPIFKTKER